MATNNKGQFTEGHESLKKFHGKFVERTCSFCRKLFKRYLSQLSKANPVCSKLCSSMVKKGISFKNGGQFKKGVVSWNKGVKMSILYRNKLAKLHLGHKHSKETKKKMGISKMGYKNWRWIVDRTMLKDDSKERGGQLHREWSNNVKNRDIWKCKITNKDCSGRLEAHHILGWTEHVELRYEINNGITLCHAHHPRKKCDELRLFPYFQKLVTTIEN